MHIADDLPFVRQFDILERTIDVLVDLKDSGEAMVRLEAMRSSSGVYSINAYVLEDVQAPNRTPADVTRSWVTYGIPLIERPTADAALREALEVLGQHCSLYAPAAEKVQYAT